MLEPAKIAGAVNTTSNPAQPASAGAPMVRDHIAQVWDGTMGGIVDGAP